MYKNIASWQDVFFCSEHSVFPELQEKVSEYAKIPKYDLTTRRDFLENIISLYKSNISKHILNAFILRLEYFNQLVHMYDTGILYKDCSPQVYDETRVVASLTLKKNSKKLKYPNKEVFYGNQMNDIWGDAYLDILDPAHRNLIFWKQVWQNSGSKLPFFTALEEYIMPPNTPHIFFYDDLEIEKRKATIFNNQILLENTPVNSPDVVDDSNQTMFIINENNELLIDFSSKHIRHISLSSGKPVLGGGLMVIKNGYLQEISNSSGHYLFNTDDFIQTIKLLFEQGIQIHHDVIVDHWYAFSKNERLPFSEFCARYKLDV